MLNLILRFSRFPRSILGAIWPAVLAFAVPLGTSAAVGVPGALEVTLNGLKITIDEQTGGIVGLEYPGVGKMLAAKPSQAGIIDVAYPLPEFEPLRLAARHSSQARVETAADSVMISWENLGPSRSHFKVPGRISAKVSITAMADGRSLTMKCRIENHSERPVRQVMFPDFHGLLPFAGEDETYFRTAGFVRRPFVEIEASTYPEFYALEHGDTQDTAEYIGGRNYSGGASMVGRWLDYGGLNGGLSLFPKLWASGVTKVRISRLKKEPNVRLMHQHDTSIQPGAVWESPEYVLTPHTHGWAKGIVPYREYVQSNVHRRYPVPQHVREGLGYRTIWMCKGFPADGDNDVAFKIADLPRVAQESKAHGLDELVVWFWHEPFTLPVPPPYSHLGTAEELTQAIKECNALGVNVSLFTSILSISEPTASRYGWQVGPGWTYHPELFPRFNPSYAVGRKTKAAAPGLANYSLWEKDVLESVQYIYDHYTRSICWDQVRMAALNLYDTFIPWGKERDPRATFSGEITGGPERCASFLDYTWNWESGSYHHNLNIPYRDDRGFTAAFPSPRLNKGVNQNAQQIKFYFMDNNYLNVMPTAPDEPNGTAWIRDYPEVSRVLKQCADLRRQFLNYFVDGTLIADGLLRESVPGTHIGGYVLPDRALFMVMNTADEARPVNFSLALKPWLESASGKYEVRTYDQHGKRLKAGTIIGSDWKGRTPPLNKLDFAIYEFIAQ